MNHQIVISINIEAVQYDGNNGWKIEQWSRDIDDERQVIESPVLEPCDDNTRGCYLQVETFEGGTDTANPSDWIRKMENGFLVVLFEKDFE